MVLEKRWFSTSHDEAAMDEIAADPALKHAEMYMEGRVKVAEGDINDFLALVKSNTLSEALSFGMIWRGMARIIAAPASRCICRSTTTRATSPITTI